MKQPIAAIFLAIASWEARIAANATADEWIGPIEQAESGLRETIRAENGPQEIYALLTEGTFGNIGQRFLFVFKERALLHCDDGNGRIRERDLATDETAKLRRWLLKNKVDELPQFDEGMTDGIQYEYFHIQRDGREHCVFMNNPPSAPIGPAAFFGGSTPAPKRKLYGELTRRMLKLDEKSMRVTYPALEKMAGFQVVHAKEEGEVTAISDHGGQLFAGVKISNDKPTAWHVINEKGLSAESRAGKPEPLKRQFWPKFLDWGHGVNVYEGHYAGKRLWAGTRQVDKVDALWASGSRDNPELVARGMFGKPVICPRGEWIVVAKTEDGKLWDVPNGVVRIHLPSKRVFPIDLPPADNFEPVTWVEARKRVLLYQQRDREDWKAGPERPEFYLLDPITGVQEKVEGEMRPFFDDGNADLQPTGQANEFWAALHASTIDPSLHSTTIGRFDSYNFRFTQLLIFPDISFGSSHFLVDQTAGLVWINVNGDLLRLSLPN